MIKEQEKQYLVIELDLFEGYEMAEDQDRVWEYKRNEISRVVHNKLDERDPQKYPLNRAQRRAINWIWNASRFPERRNSTDHGSASIMDFITPERDNFQYILNNQTHQEFSSGIIIGHHGTIKKTVSSYGSLLYVTDPQYRSNQESMRVFLCTSTNYGANRIFQKIKEILDENHLRNWEVYFKRVIAQSLPEEDIPEDIRHCIIRSFPSNPNDLQIHRQQLERIRIFVGTVYACNDLLQYSRRVTCQSVIFDEASQLTPPQMYLPIAKNTAIRSFGLVGDNCQLPPISSLEPLTRSSIDYLLGLPRFNNSRIQRRITLDIQYRMHPAIRDISSRFAERGGEIIHDDESVVNESYLLSGFQDFDRKIPFDQDLNNIFHPRKTVVILDTSNLGDISLDSRRSRSRINQVEANIVSSLVTHLQSAYPDFLINNENLKLIAPYKSQAELIHRITGFNANTVDAFQGQEARVVFYSMTFAEPDITSRFAQNVHRIYVALSRAQKKLIVIGNRRALDQEYFHYLHQNIFDYEYNNTLEVNSDLGYDPVTKISIDPNFYEYLINYN